MKIRLLISILLTLAGIMLLVASSNAQPCPSHLLLGVVDQRAKIRPFSVPALQRTQGIWRLIDGFAKRRPEPVPPGYVEAHLGPREDPRNRAQVLKVYGSAGSGDRT